MKNLFKAAHKLTKEIKAEYPNVDYKAQFGICLSYLQNKKGDCKMVELKGTERQVAWAKDIRKDLITLLNDMKDKKDLVLGNCENEDEKTKMIKSFNRTVERVEKVINEETNAKFYIEDARDDITNKASVVFAKSARFRTAYESLIEK
ncbi:hypothetical protein [Clostridium sporogenes]|uniref:hypothetical protein n=1 Tax=Clostridium sporogenes TaxID=1509 RepID=UPI000666CCCC|nr:hypothetical protein [Clostridium sporogenes]